MAEAMQLQQDMVDFCAATREQVATLLARTPLELRPRRTKVNLDDDPESTEAERLPPPLQPQVVARGGTPSGTMCRSLSDFLSNLTETACTNSSFTPSAPEIVPETVTEAIGSGVKSGTAEAGIEPFKSDVTEDERNLNAVSDTPAVSVTTEDAVTGSAADGTAEENSLLQADDSASVSSLLLDGTVTGTVDISLLDDPFIAIGAGCEKDSLLEEQDGDPNWTAGDSDGKGFEVMPMTSSPDPSSDETVGGNAVSSEVDDSWVLNTVASLADTDSSTAVATTNNDDGGV